MTIQEHQARHDQGSMSNELFAIISGAIIRKNQSEGDEVDQMFDSEAGRHEVVQAILDDLSAAGWTLTPPHRC